MTRWPHSNGTQHTAGKSDHLATTTNDTMHARVKRARRLPGTAYQRQLVVMLAPVVLGLLLLIIVPAMLTIPVAFTNFDALTTPDWSGLANFREMLGDHLFWNGVRASLLFVALAVPLRLLGALLLALLLYQHGRGMQLFRGAVYLPTIVPDVAYVLLWLYLFNPLFSPLNALLPLVGGSEGWLLDSTSAQLAIVLVLFWTLGEGFVLLMAALQEVPRELHETAAIDGASVWQCFRAITLPLLAPMLLLVAFRDTVFSFQANFVATVILTKGGPYYATSYLPYWIYQNATEFQRFGYAAAMMLVMFLITAVVIVLQFAVVRRWRAGHFE